MNYKISKLLKLENRSFGIAEQSECSKFLNFGIKAIENNEFIISNNEQKISVQLGEIFKFNGARYFIFDPNAITFLYENSNKKQRILSFYCLIKKSDNSNRQKTRLIFQIIKYLKNKSQKFYLILLLFVFLIFYTNQLNKLDIT